MQRTLCPWGSPGKNTGVGWHSLIQGIFPTQGSNSGLPHWRQILYHLINPELPLHLFFFFKSTDYICGHLDGPVIRTPHFHFFFFFTTFPLQGAQVPSLVRKLGSHMPNKLDKKKKGLLFLKLTIYIRIYFWTISCSIELCVCPFTNTSLSWSLWLPNKSWK